MASSLPRRLGFGPALMAARTRLSASWAGAVAWGGRLERRLAEVAGRARRWVATNPVTGPVTAMGWTVLVAGFVLGLGGLVLGWLEFRALGIMAAVLLLLAIAFVVGRADHVATLRLAATRVAVGDVGEGIVEVRSRDGRALSAHDVELPVGQQVARFRVGGLAGQDVHETPFGVPTRRRGVKVIGPVRAVRSDPLGLLRRVVELAPRQELFVHPATVAVRMGAVGLLRDIEGVTTLNLSSSDVSFHALRDYQPGDDRRSIHWRSTARTGRLIVRQFEESMRAHLLLVLSTRAADYATEDEFELAVSIAASVGLAAVREERQVSLCTSTGLAKYPGGSGLLDELSRVELEKAAADFPLAVSHAFTAAPSASVAALITGSRTSPSDLRLAHGQLGPNLMSFAVRAGDAFSRTKIGRLTVLDVSALEELGRALRAVA